MTSHLKCSAYSQTIGRKPVYLRWIRITGAFQQLILPTTGKMSTHSDFKAIIRTQNRCDTALKVSFSFFISRGSQDRLW